MPVVESEINKNRSNGIRTQKENQPPAVTKNAKSAYYRRRRRPAKASNENKENVISNETSASVSNVPNDNQSTKNKRRRRRRRPAAPISEHPETNTDSTENVKTKNPRRRRGRSNQSKTKYLYEFKCDCGQKWVNSTSKGECRKCEIEVKPHNKYEKKPGLTPYQGPGRTYGHFRCSECDKFWTSAYSWANYGQECKDCLINIYPFMQRPFIRQKRSGSEKATNKPHPQELCGKCTADHSSCTLRE